MEDQCPTEYSVMHDAQWETTRDLSVNYLRENDRDQDYLNRDNALDVIHIYIVNITPLIYLRKLWAPRKKDHRTANSFPVQPTEL